MDKTVVAKIYRDLVKANRRDESSIPEEFRTEYERLKKENADAK
ncbi:hypothetical protein [Paenibacillus sp. AN1007]|uniref:Fur-regulated basic protein FbpA n=1 Tax=Paenibacillus sp. AN1007 TaxID=3151385 RepID=A0AAU8NI11_9BACL